MKMVPTKQQIEDGIVHISFEMNRYLRTANPISLPRPYGEAVAESCLLHSRNIGEFFFNDATKDDIRITQYYDLLTSKNELEDEIEKFRPKWDQFKTRINKKLGHLTFSRIDTSPMEMQEKNELNFEVLIQMFENALPKDFREKWEHGKSIGGY